MGAHHADPAVNTTPDAPPEATTILRQPPSTWRLIQGRAAWPLTRWDAVWVAAPEYPSGNTDDSALPARPTLVNANYLERGPVQSPAGDPVQLDRQDLGRVAPYPDKCESEEQSIRGFSDATRFDQEAGRGDAQAEEEIFDESAPELPLNQELKLIQIASNQKIFSFRGHAHAGSPGTHRRQI